MVCPGCGGIVGQDCWNPQECEWISHDMTARRAATELDPLHQSLKVGHRVKITDPPAGWSDVTGTVKELSYGAVVVSWDNGETCWEAPAKLNPT